MMRISGILRPAPAEPIAKPARLPDHVAIIMDGNGRWAKSRGLPRTAGHKKGTDTLRTILNACRETGIHYLTIYAFSSENWKRPTDEISDLMQILRHYLEQELRNLHENNIRLRFIGDLAQLAPDIRGSISDAVTLTSGNSAFNLTVALSYGSRQEMVRAIRALAQKVQSGELAAADISEEMVAETLDTVGIPEPDLLIRTGGERRLSNFLLWQSAYTEFYFTPVLWPDFDTNHFMEALQDYARRERRFGTTGDA